MEPEVKQLFEAATRPYLGAGRYALHFVRGKLRHDPVFFAVLRRGVLPDRGTLLDLGCGHGILLSLLKAANEQYQARSWPPDWPAPPQHLALHGIEKSGGRVRAAREALGAAAQVDAGDLRELELRPCSAIAMVDVLLYLEETEQQRLLDKAAAALQPGGVLLLRETDRDGGFAFHVTKWGERTALVLRGEFRQTLHLHYRGMVQWLAELAQRGFSVEAEPMSAGTPFATVLFVARKGPISG